jgi:hypothetical protein
MLRSTSLTAIAATLCVVFAASHAIADTVAYWRFEGEGNAWLNDSSGNGRTLTPWHGANAGSTASAYQVAAPAGFFNPVPQTGAPNASAARLEASAVGGTRLAAADNAAFTSNTITLELMARLNANQVNLGFLVGHFNGSNNQRSYALTVSNDGNRLVMQLSPNGSSNTAVNSPFQLTVGRDYYIAAAISTGTTEAERFVTFYLKDLTDSNAALQSATVAHSVTSLNNAATPFALGAQGEGGSAANLDAIIDEVRVSNVVLTQDQLLVIPEPASLALLGLGAVCMLGRRRRT